MAIERKGAVGSAFRRRGFARWLLDRRSGHLLVDVCHIVYGRVTLSILPPAASLLAWPPTEIREDVRAREVGSVEP